MIYEIIVVVIMTVLFIRVVTLKSAFRLASRTYTKNRRTEETTVAREFKKQQVQIDTCGEIYHKWNKENKYWKVPNGALKFNVSYIDTLIDESDSGSVKKSQTLPTVLALHGSPGSYEDFSILISSLYGHGIRVIAPSFPDFSLYEPGVFRHSAEEKAQFIQDFLKKIKVDKLDLIICHSSGIYPSLRLCVENYSPKINGLVMLNAAFYSKNTRGLKPYWFVYGLARLSEFSFALNILKLLRPLLLKLFNSPVRNENMFDPLLGATTMVFADFPKAKENLQILASKKFPILFMFSENDKLIDRHFVFEMAFLLGAKENDIFYYDEDGILTQSGIEKESLKVMAFKKGSHYVFWKYPEIIKSAIVSFLHRHAKKD